MPTQQNSQTEKKPIVFYDGGCPLCSKEIRHYKRITGADKLDWLDISDSKCKLDSFGIAYETAMARFHVLDASGQWQTGAWGFVELWSHLRGYRWLAKLISLTSTQALLDKIYTVFAQKRLNSRCSQASCGN